MTRVQLYMLCSASVSLEETRGKHSKVGAQVLGLTRGVSRSTRAPTKHTKVGPQVDRRKHPPPGGPPIWQVPYPRTQRKRTPPRSIWYKFFQGGPLLPGSSLGSLSNRRPPRGGGFRAIKVLRSIEQSEHKHSNFVEHHHALVPTPPTLTLQLFFDSPIVRQQRSLFSVKPFTVLDDLLIPARWPNFFPARTCLWQPSPSPKPPKTTGSARVLDPVPRWSLGNLSWCTTI